MEMNCVATGWNWEAERPVCTTQFTGSYLEIKMKEIRGRKWKTTCAYWTSRSADGARGRAQRLFAKTNNSHVPFSFFNFPLLFTRFWFGSPSGWWRGGGLLLWSLVQIQTIISQSSTRGFRFSVWLWSHQRISFMVTPFEVLRQCGFR